MPVAVAKKSTPGRFFRSLSALVLDPFTSRFQSMSIPRDVQEFLDGYPGVEDDPTWRENFEFYSNDIRCIPDNRTIAEIHERLRVYIPRIM